MTTSYIEYCNNPSTCGHLVCFQECTEYNIILHVLTSSSNMSLRPLRNSSSMLSISVPALRRWELHHAVKVWQEKLLISIKLWQ